MAINYGFTANVLVYNPVFGYSHVKFLSKLADIMADGGYQVTVLHLFHLPMKNIEGLIENKNIEILNYYPDNFEEMAEDVQTFPFFWDSKSVSNPFMEPFVMPSMLESLYKNASTKFIKDTDFHNDLLKRNFDLLIYEPSDFTGAYFANMMGIRTVPVLSTVRMEFIDSLFGVPSSLGYVPKDFSRLAPRAGLFDRVNDIVRGNLRSLTAILAFGRQTRMLEEAVGERLPHWKTLVSDSPLLFVNSNPYIDFSSPTLDNIVKIGGIGMKTKWSSEELSREYEEILRERERTVLISFGSVVRSHEMPLTFKLGLIKMFTNFPNITFIWKYEKEDDINKILPENVHLKKWVPQSALLADDRLALFITHGGLGSIMELAYSGKPGLVVPIFGDQFYNAAMLERHGGALSLDKMDLANGEKLTSFVKELVTNSRFEKQAEILQGVLSFQPNDPKDQFLKYLEFAIRFPEFRSHHPEISKQSWVSYYYLDAFLVITFLFLLILYVFLKIFLLLNLIFSKKQKQE